MAKEIDIGAYSAYAIAVEHGYEGTEAEFAAQLMNSAANGALAQDGAERAEAAAAEAAEILASIPEDYTTLSERAVENTEKIKQLSEEIGDFEAEMYGKLFAEKRTIGNIVTIPNAKEGQRLFVSADNPEGTTVIRCGKNLYNPAAATNYKTLDAIGNVIDTTEIFCVSPLIPINGVATFTFDTTMDGAVIALYDANKNFVSMAWKGTSPQTITNDDARYVRIQTVIEKKGAVQVELSETATEFESYVEDTVDVTNAAYSVVPAINGLNHLYATNGNVIYKEYVPKEDTSELDSILSALPTLYLSGSTAGMSKDDAVTLNYAWKGMTGTCTVKWQGSSSIGFPKKNYTIKFDTAFEAKEGWGSQKKYCFKANWVDASHVRNIVSAKLWGQIVKSRTTPNERLNALPNAGAIDGFPCIIRLNEKFLGLYTWNIPKDGWMLGMGDGDNECIICANGTLGTYNSCGFQAPEGEFGQGFDLEYITDENDTSWALDSLNALIDATKTNNFAELNNRIDWDSTYDYMIFAAVIGHIDGITKNYLLSTYDGVKWFFTGYDMDGTFGNHPNGQSFYKAASPARPEVNRLNHRLFAVVNATPSKRAELKARYTELRASVLSEDNICYVAENFVKGIPANVYAEDWERWPTVPSTSVNNITQIRDWIRRRLPIIDADFEAM